MNSGVAFAFGAVLGAVVPMVVLSYFLRLERRVYRESLDHFREALREARTRKRAW